MTATEPVQGGPYPEPSDPPDGPNQMAAITTWASGRMVMRFASITARDAALTTPVEGMIAMTGSGTSLTEWRYRNGTWIDVTDVPWATWVPALTATTTAPSIGTGATYSGRWCRQGRVVRAEGWITWGTSPSPGSGAYRLSLPIEAVTTGSPAVGTAWLYDASGTLTSIAVAMIIDATHLNLRHHGGTAEVGSTAPWTWAASDQIRWSVTYEAA